MAIPLLWLLLLLCKEAACAGPWTRAAGATTRTCGDDGCVLGKTPLVLESADDDRSGDDDPNGDDAENNAVEASRCPPAPDPDDQNTPPLDCCTGWKENAAPTEESP